MPDTYWTPVASARISVFHHTVLILSSSDSVRRVSFCQHFWTDTSCCYCNIIGSRDEKHKDFSHLYIYKITKAVIHVALGFARGLDVSLKCELQRLSILM